VLWPEISALKAIWRHSEQERWWRTKNEPPFARLRNPGSIININYVFVSSLIRARLRSRSPTLTGPCVSQADRELNLIVQFNQNLISMQFTRSIVLIVAFEDDDERGRERERER
jgi:hypothetical protein